MTPSNGIVCNGGTSTSSYATEDVTFDWHNVSCQTIGTCLTYRPAAHKELRGCSGGGQL